MFRGADIPSSQGIHSMTLGEGRVRLVLDSLGNGISTLFLATAEIDEP